MTCYHPMRVYQCQETKKIYFGRSLMDSNLTLPCGQCVGCRLERSRQWAIRCMHEASLYANNCFITLTYDNDHLPDHGTLLKSDFQKFMKRFRKRFSGIEPITSSDGSIVRPIRFYMAGEYGATYGRPHYHACIFNFDFSDKYHWRRSPSGLPLYRSPALEELWPLGNSEIGTVTFQSAAYVARYIMKKVNGKDASQHYVSSIDPVTGEIFSRLPEYNDMSRRPGIAYGWFEKFVSDVYPHDHVIVNGRSVRPPKYYDNKFKAVHPAEFEAVQFDRHEKMKKYVDNTTPSRLAVREHIQNVRLDLLKRTLD